ITERKHSESPAGIAVLLPFNDEGRLAGATGGGKELRTIEDAGVAVAFALRPLVLALRFLPREAFRLSVKAWLPAQLPAERNTILGTVEIGGDNLRPARLSPVVDRHSQPSAEILPSASTSTDVAHPERLAEVVACRGVGVTVGMLVGVGTPEPNLVAFSATVARPHGTFQLGRRMRAHGCCPRSEVERRRRSSTHSSRSLWR